MNTHAFVLLVLLSIAVIYFSRRVLFRPSAHGFYRFFSWEAIVILFVLNYPFWFLNPTHWMQVCSWFCLICSALLVITGLFEFRHGKQSHNRADETLFSFEKTTVLIQTGIYRHVRHPMYGSLIFLTWGIFFKHFSSFAVALAGISSIFLFLSAQQEEKENIRYFGDQYREYMQNSWMFIPFIL